MWPEDRYGVVRREAALDVGYTDRDIRAALVEGELTMLEPGYYVRTAVLPEYDLDDAIYRLRCIAAATGSDLPLSHQSAAAVLGIDLLGPDRRRVHFSKPRLGGGRETPYRHIHSGLPDDSVMLVDGILVSTPARTVVDATAGTSFSCSLAGIDSAGRLDVSIEEIEFHLRRRRVRGGAVVAAALPYADPLSANPGESWGRAQMIEAGLPLPVLQREFVLLDGSHVFTDYCWGDKVAGEFDGKRKFGRDLEPGQSIEDAVFKEKVREDRLRDHVDDVVRWIFDDLRLHRMIPMLARRLRRAGIDW